MLYLHLFEDFNNIFNTLIIVDVQHSFSKYFTDKYLDELKKYCQKFKKVYQIWDNHCDVHVDNDYLYEKEPDVPSSHNDLYIFPNQLKGDGGIIEKRYKYQVNVDFFKNILDESVLNDIKTREKSGSLKEGDLFKTTEDTAIVYINNNHKWMHVPLKLYNLFLELKGQTVVFVGGSETECLLDVVASAKAMGINVVEDKNYIYSATHCPF